MRKEKVYNNEEEFLSICDFKESASEIKEILLMYSCAIKEIKTKLEILNEEFQIKRKRNPIEYMKTRVKSPSSIMEKLVRRGFDVSIESAKENLYDIAGVRVICSYVEDIYTVAQILLKQDDIRLVQCKDYIKNPKPNGYRSLHLVIEIPVFFSDRTEHLRAEVQIRTIAMDFWASLEHKLHYKTVEEVPEEIVEDLKECADTIAQTDKKMQQIHKRLELLASYED